MLVGSPLEWRSAALAGNSGAIFLDNDIDFQNEIFVPMDVNMLHGNNHIVKNVHIEMPTTDHVGLINQDDVSLGNIDSYNPHYIHSVADLTLENCSIKGDDYVGAFGGMNISVTNCKVLGNSVIEGTGDNVGGIVGLNRYEERDTPVITKSYVGEQTTVKGINNVGGIMGAFSTIYTSYMDRSVNPLDDCISRATVTALSDNAGGICGKIGPDSNQEFNEVAFLKPEHSFLISKCVNEGKVTGRNNVGGIGGYFGIRQQVKATELPSQISIYQSYSDAEITGETNVGGIVGKTYSPIRTCYSRGVIKANQSVVGGIAGEAYEGLRLNNCYSLADIQVGTDGVAGGIVGKTAKTYVSYNYFSGTNANGCGIVGHSDGNVEVKNCVTTLSSLGTTAADVEINSKVGVTSIKDNKDIINVENAYSDTCWPETVNKFFSLKFADFFIDTEVPNFDQETV